MRIGLLSPVDKLIIQNMNPESKLPVLNQYLTGWRPLISLEEVKSKLRFANDCSAQTWNYLLQILFSTENYCQNSWRWSENSPSNWSKKGGEKFAATHTSHGCLSQTPSRQSCLGSWYTQEEEKETLIYCQELSTTEAIMKQFTDHNLVEIAAFRRSWDVLWVFPFSIFFSCIWLLPTHCVVELLLFVGMFNWWLLL